VAAEERLTPRRRLAIGAVTLLLASAGFATGRILLRPAVAVAQPVRFNHRLHVETLELDCSTCHEFYASSEHSGLPSLELCSTCHEEALTDSPEEQRLLELIEAGGDQEFRKLFRMPDHVYYSHARHVTVAGIECATCHGGIAETTAPPPVPLVHVTMNTCVGCHAASGAPVECTHCHR